MLESLTQLDQTIFFFINGTLANPVTDLIMPIITSDWVLRILYAVIVIMLLIKGDRKLRWLVLFSIVTLALTDQISSMYLKEWIARPRPCHTIPVSQIHLLVNCGSGKSMPSSHAANCFGQALLFGLVYRRVWWELIIFASLVALSRVFVGVHYPGDVLVGALVGALVAIPLVYAFRALPISKISIKNTP
jgi:membrane-associated phospholipid phosphatase